MSTVADYVARNAEQLERLRQLVDRLSDADLVRQDPDGEWTVADALLHLAFYDRRAQILLEKYLAEGVTPSPYDPQTINDALLPLGRRVPPRAAAEEAVAAAEAADRAAAAISEGLLAEILARQEVKPDRSEHRKSHLDDIDRMLAAG